MKKLMVKRKRIIRRQKLKTRKLRKGKYCILLIYPTDYKTYLAALEYINVVGENFLLLVGAVQYPGRKYSCDCGFPGLFSAAEQGKIRVCKDLGQKNREKPV